MTEALDEVVNAVTTWAATHGIPVINGTLDKKESIAVVNWDVDVSHETMLKVLEGMDISFLVLDVDRLTKEYWEEHVTSLEALPHADEVRDALGAARRCKQQIGKISYVFVSAFVRDRAIAIEWARFAEWYDAMYDAELFDDAGEDLEVKRENRMDELARRIANDERFQKAKKQAEREYVVRQVLKTEADVSGKDVWHIAQRAQAIHTMEVKLRGDDA